MDRIFYMQLHDRDSYGYDTDVAGYLRIDSFAMASASTICGQTTVTHGCLLIVLSCLYVILISVMNRTLSASICIYTYLSISVRIMSVWPLLLRIDFDCKLTRSEGSQVSLLDKQASGVRPASSSVRRPPF